MKTRILLMLIMAAALFVSCQKEKEPVATDQEVTFSATLVQPDLKNSEDLLPCKTDVATHARVKINGIYYDPQVFFIGTKLYTQAIKLPAGAYTIQEFFLYKDNAPAGYGAEDVVTYATPADGSAYEVYLNPLWDLPYEFSVTAFTKIELDIEVLCFVDLLYQNFGFFWFDITEIIIREQCFFGDFCIKHVEEYNGSSYWLQPGHPATGFYDAPAIIQLVVEQQIGGSWIPVHGSPFTNDFLPNYGVGAPVCIEYPDVVGVVDNYRVTLKILVKVGNGFQFVPFHVWTFQDGFMIVPPAPNGDGIVDFVMGTCNLTPTDLQLLPYQNLPATCDLQVGNSAPGTKKTYFDVTLSNIGPGYDIYNGIWGVYCADQQTNITGNSWHPGIGVYSSLWPALLPAFVEQQAKDNLDQANWLANHLQNYPGYGTLNFYKDVQNALWIILDYNFDWNASSLGYPSAIAQQMAADAATHNGYVPLPGGWAAVVFCESASVQIIFTMVDP